jgi:small subunit ribosomal protein S21
MLIVKVKENESIDKALKRFKKKFEQTKVLKEIRRRAHYTKPSVEQRDKDIRAKYKQAMYAQENF